MYNYKNENVCEILAPAGTYESMVTAFNAGADAVYLGGELFGARAQAENFTEETLIEAIDYAHLRGKSVYLTVNTLLKEEELKKLKEYILPLYRAGLDAVIVQDTGVLKFIRDNFKDLPIHASTQMTITGANFANYLKKYNVTRIVTSRELSLKEISLIYENTKMEIESFVHGALCYSFSGQCLFSSIIGGRSGNRGRCAQPCRMPYEFIDDKKGKKINDDNTLYQLSPKDLCSINNLKEVLGAGIFSLKIEGRMKKPEYVASVVSTYKKYIDALIEKGEVKVDQADIENLKDIYNRGGFTEGFFKVHNGADIMSTYKPNHFGSKVAKIMGFDKGNLKLEFIRDVNKDDVLEINLFKNERVEVPISEDYKKGSIKTIKLDQRSFKNNTLLYENWVYRTRNNKLIKEFSEKFINEESKVMVNGYAVLKLDKEMTLTLNFKDKYVSVSGDFPKVALNKPMNKENIYKQLNKTGNTDFVFESLDIDSSEGIFVSVSELNELRRNAFIKLREEILKPFKREIEDFKPVLESKKNFKESIDMEMEVLVSDKIQLEKVLLYREIRDISLEVSAFSYEEIFEIIKRLYSMEKRVYLALPYICRSAALNEFEKYRNIYTSDELKGVIVRNHEELIYFKEMYKDCNDKEIIADHNIYIYNNNSIEFNKEAGADMVTLPLELNKKELESINTFGQRAEVYGYAPLMTSAGCVKKTNNLCDKKDGINTLLDRFKNEFKVINRCRYCYNTILNNKPLMLYSYMEDFKDFGIKKYVLRFTFETGEETEKVLKIFSGQVENDLDFTRGHYKRGVI